MKYLAISDVLLNYYSSLDFFHFQSDSKNEFEIQFYATKNRNQKATDHEQDGREPIRADRDGTGWGTWGKEESLHVFFFV